MFFFNAQKVGIAAVDCLMEDAKMTTIPMNVTVQFVQNLLHIGAIRVHTHFSQLIFVGGRPWFKEWPAMCPNEQFPFLGQDHSRY